MKTDQKVVSNDSTSTRLSHHSPASKRHFLTANYLPLLSTTSKLHTGRLGYHSNPWIAFRRLPSRRVFPTVALTLRIWDAEHAPQERSDRDDFHQHRRITPATELLQKSFAPLSQAHPIFSLDNWTHHNRTETLTSTKRKVVPFYWQRMGRGCIPNDFLEKIRKTPPTSRTTNHDAGFPPLYVSHPKRVANFFVIPPILTPSLWQDLWPRRGWKFCSITRFSSSGDRQKPNAILPIFWYENFVRRLVLCFFKPCFAYFHKLSDTREVENFFEA